MNRLMAWCGIMAGAGLMVTASGCGGASAHQSEGYQTQQANRASDYEYHTENSFVGPQGAQGPAGQAGQRGEKGYTGPEAYAMAGPRGERGPTGYAGPQGPTGATGPSGAVVRGRVGERGPAGPSGQQGQRGSTGARGESTPGYAGPAGPQGPTGPQGEMGRTGNRGATLEGPTGPAGTSGPSGARGVTGYAGSQGSTTPGLSGPEGPMGAQGSQGRTGEIGSQGRVGVVDRWTSYRELWFANDSAAIQNSERYKLAEIATYMKQNPSLQLGIDAGANQRGDNSRDRNLGERRINAIRDALMNAGVSGRMITSGTFGDQNLRRNGRVEVFLASAN